ncbi:ER-golgi trafficking TRAPP I complex 85 kDa subunit-domain-containing protein [Coniochaeta hoffmannii]|uniref:ER-golgi trafficking TRAPP I complex 85 kDa subunit-domain-containing protein n=1 Tax=Coniochaeta hoffmannii TaxID=91930 RepID=A0AA38VIR2_9PEZI|nr:ER-golgi trafficking TRAPP I complex 85 kDa subunit-domain-containing protein [Coniochaeta hoffmannii]
MQSPDNASPNPISPMPLAASPMKLAKQRQSLPSQPLPNSTINDPLSASTASLPYRDRRSNPSTASLFASTLTPPGSRSSSPAPGSRPASGGTLMTGSVFGNAGFKHSLLDTAAADNPGDPLNLVLKSFVPHVAVYGSEDVDELVREKGFEGGLWEILRPFGERLQGRVTVRDSIGGSKSWDDFSVRLVRFGEGVELPEPLGGASRLPPPLGTASANGGGAASPRNGGRIAQVEAVVERHLSYAESAFMGHGDRPATPVRQGLDVDATSPYYSLYLRRLLSGIPVAAHETFAHPVASVVAISSRNPAPIETLRRLYAETSQGEKKLPVWVDPEYLRYYVLVHDEERSDITKSMALFEQMKRHLGLHCHLLRLRSSQSAETDDDSIPLPKSEWMTPAEELEILEKTDEHEDFADHTRYIFESDATAIRTFIREMVTSSIVPTMERNVSVWNDQVASRRRGLSGRFMSLSKRWAFGGGSRTSSSGGSNGSSNFESLGFYRPDTPEAIMRKLADYAFMLRDWKLAMSTYDLLRGDFQNDKAWKYHAAASEMAALALLIMPQNMSSKTRIETINGMLEQALYSYTIRCGSQFGALRCLVLAVELLRLRGGSGIDEAVKLGIRLLDERLVGAVGDSLLKERMAVCYASKTGMGSQAWGSRRRKSAFWSVLGAEAWIKQSKFIQAQRCLNEARKMYSSLPSEYGVQKFVYASEFMAQLQAQLKEGLSLHDNGTGRHDHGGGGGEDVEEEVVEEESVPLDRRRSRRMSLITAQGSAGGAGLETAPLTPLVPAHLLVTDKEKDGGNGKTDKDGFG